MTTANPARSIRILVVDDEADFADLTANYLDRLLDTAVVETATGADECLDSIEMGDVPDCIVCDYDMPGIDGLELLRRVRDTHPKIPFILFTGKGSEEIASRAISAGVTDYLQKSGRREQFERLANRVEHATGARRAEQVAERTDAHLQAILQSAPDVILTIDDESTIQYVSDAVEAVFGYDPEELVGRSLTVLMPTRFHARHRDGLHRYRREGDRRIDWTGTEFPAKHRDGHELPVSISFGEFTADGEHYFTGIIRDRSERKARRRELVETESFLQSALDALDDVFFVFDTDGQLLEYNQRLPTITGYQPADLETVAPAAFIVEEDHARIREAIQECIRSGEARVQATLLTADGDRIPVDLRAHTLTDDDGEVFAIAGVGRKIADSD